MKRHAILIANSQFPEHPNLPNLETPENDVKQLEKVLKDSTRDFLVSTAINKASHEIGKVLALHLNQKSDPNDLFLIYYSGHGILESDLSLSLAAKDSDPANPASFYLFENVMKTVEQSRLKRVVILLDCCYSGAAVSKISPILESKNSTLVSEEEAEVSLSKRGFKEQTRSTLELTSNETDFELKSAETGIWILTASSASQPAYAEKGDMGVFTRFLVSGFEGHALTTSNDEENPYGAITINGLFRHIHRGIQTTGIIQTPRIYSKDASHPDMVIAEIISLVGEHHSVEFHLWDESSLLENMVPTYLLDNKFRFLHWNASFQALIAEPLSLMRGAHVETFLKQLVNWDEVAQRSARDFPPEGSKYPRVHVESLKLQTSRWGYVDFTKVASHVRDKEANWCVMLNIDYAEREKEIWGKLKETMTSDETWSLYAKNYDSIIASFSENKELVKKVVERIGRRENCLDIGAGTGSTTIEMLKTLESRKVHAIDMNYFMLKCLHQKVLENDAYQTRTRITHSDCLSALTSLDKNGKFLELNDEYDAVVMMNVFFALEKPVECLKAIHRVLKPGGIIVISTSDETTDIEALFRTIKQELKMKKWDATIKEAYEDALSRNREMEKIIKQYTEKNVRSYLREAGFIVNRQIERKVYVGCVFIMIASK